MPLRRAAFVVLLVLVCFHLTACGGGGGGDDVYRYDPGMPSAIAGLVVTSGNQVVKIRWDNDPVSTHYKVYYAPAADGLVLTPETATVITVYDGPWYNLGQDDGVELQNGTEYVVMVTGLNHNGEGDPSAQDSTTPLPPSPDDLAEVPWYFHTLVTGTGARWEKGLLSIDAEGQAQITEFEDSSGNTALPAAFEVGMEENGDLLVSGAGPGDWHEFHGTMGSTKEMIIGTYSPDPTSRALIVLQKRATDDAPPYKELDFSGTGSGQIEGFPELDGNGPTRFVYHQLYSGASTEWEYCNAKIGRQGVGTWPETRPPVGEPTLPYKGSTYWDFSTPTFKTVGRTDEDNYAKYWSSKATVYGIDPTGLVTEYWSFEKFCGTEDVEPIMQNFNDAVPLQAHDTLFSGRMTRDKTMVIGVHTRTDANGENPQYFMRIIQLCFIPTYQGLPEADIDDLIGNYTFHKVATAAPDSSTPGEASWSYGTMAISKDGETGVSTFDNYLDSHGNTAYPANADYPNILTFSYYSDQDINPDRPIYPDFANYTTAVQKYSPHYYSNVDGNPLRDYRFWAVYLDPSEWAPMPISMLYYNDHASMSINREMMVMTRTDPLGYTMMIGLK